MRVVARTSRRVVRHSISEATSQQNRGFQTPSNIVVRKHPLGILVMFIKNYSHDFDLVSWTFLQSALYLHILSNQHQGGEPVSRTRPQLWRIEILAKFARSNSSLPCAAVRPVVRHSVSGHYPPTHRQSIRPSVCLSIASIQDAGQGRMDEGRYLNDVCTGGEGVPK